MANYQLRAGNAGPIVEGDNDGDTLVWDASLRRWAPGPGGGGGATVQPGTIDGQIPVWDGSEEAYVPTVGGLLPPDTTGVPDGTQTGQVALWDVAADAYVLSSWATFVFRDVADLEAQFPAVGGVHTFADDGLYEFEGGTFDLEANRIVVTALNYRIRGWGREVTKVINDNDDDPLLTLQGSECDLADIFFKNESTELTARTLRNISARALLHDVQLGDYDSGATCIVNEAMIDAQQCVLGAPQNGSGFRVQCNVDSSTRIINSTFLDGAGQHLVRPESAATGHVNLIELRGNKIEAVSPLLLLGGSVGAGRIYDQVIVEDNSYTDIVTVASPLLVEFTDANESLLNIRVVNNFAKGAISLIAAGVDSNAIVMGNVCSGFVGFDENSANFVVRANLFAGVLLPETPIAT